MTEEAQGTNTEAVEKPEAYASTVVESTPAPASPNTKAAEKKLKEMSRKAKERGKPQNEPTRTRARSEAVIKFNQNWFLGGLGISAILAIGYFIYKSRGAISEPHPELQPFHYPPPSEKKEESVATPSEKPNAFDLNSF